MGVLDVLGAIGVVAFGLVSVVVGLRLLLLSRRTKALPEFAIGIGFVVGVLFGFVPETLLYSTDLVSAAWAQPLTRVAELSIRLCAIAVLVFTWRVFQPEARYARVVVAVLGGLMLISYGLVPLGEHSAESASDSFWVRVSFAARTASLLWGTLEALRQFSASRRRLVLGLADPVVSNRFLLWGVAMASASFLMGSVLLAPALGLSAADLEWLLAESAFGTVAAAAIWLTFFPPKAYQSWLLARGTSA